MKTLLAFFITLSLVFAPTILPGGNFSNSAQAADVCDGQKRQDWQFTVTDNDRKKVILGPYKCKKACSMARNQEVKKIKWVVVGVCEE